MAHVNCVGYDSLVGKAVSILQATQAFETKKASTTRCPIDLFRRLPSGIDSASIRSYRRDHPLLPLVCRRWLHPTLTCRPRFLKELWV